MYPWFWLWAPHVEFPLSGNVTQDIEPVANLFSKSSDPEAGNPKIEQKAFEVASYGQQLGLITEVLIEIAENVLLHKGKDNESLQRLKRIKAEIEKLKASEYDSELRDIEGKIKAIRRRGGARSQTLSRKLGELQAVSRA
jgi:hypothetical protein